MVIMNGSLKRDGTNYILYAREFFDEINGSQNFRQAECCEKKPRFFLTSPLEVFNFSSMHLATAGDSHAKLIDIYFL